jgi:hypothetical protein
VQLALAGAAPTNMNEDAKAATKTRRSFFILLSSSSFYCFMEGAPYRTKGAESRPQLLGGGRQGVKTRMTTLPVF